jgi:hypothetical protein
MTIFAPSTHAIALACGVAGAYVDVTADVVTDEPVKGSAGRSSDFDDTPPGTFSFVLDNRTGKYTPGNTASSLSTLLAENMGVSWKVDGILTSGNIRRIDPYFPSMVAASARVRVTCDDMLGNAGRRDLGTLVDSINQGATPYLFWPLDDAAGTVLPRETTGSGTALLSLTTTNGSAFGATAVPRLTSATQLTLKDTLKTPTGTVWPTFTFTYPTTTLGFYSFWITPTASSKVTAAVNISGLARSFQFGYTGGAYFVRDGDAGTPATYTLADTGAHFVSVGLGTVFSAGNWTITATLYVDGTSRGSIVYGSTVASLPYRAPVAISLTATV